MDWATVALVFFALALMLALLHVASTARGTRV